MTIFLLTKVLGNAHLNPLGVNLASANVYRTPYPLLPSQIGTRGEIAGQLPISFLPTLPPRSGSADVAPPGIISTDTHFFDWRINGGHGQPLLYYAPKLRENLATTSTSPSVISSPSLPLTEVLSSSSSLSSNTRFGSFSDEAVLAGSPPASPVDVIKWTTQSQR